MDLTDKDYVERCRDGHPEDFRELVGRYQRPLFTFLAGKVSNRSQIEELAQESFVRAFFSLKKLQKPESFYSWLLGIAARVAKEEFKRWARWQQDCQAAEVIMTEATPKTQLDYPLEEAIAALPESYRQVILLRYYEGLSCQEVATRLGTPLHTITKRLSRAYGMLRQELQAREQPQKTISRVKP